MTLELIENKPGRRDKLIIMKDIIGIAKKETSKTNIMFKANLSYTQLNEYIDFLLHHNLLEKVLAKRKIQYKATSKGLDFFEKQEHIIALFTDQSGKQNRGLLRLGFGNQNDPCLVNFRQRKLTPLWECTCP